MPAKKRTSKPKRQTRKPARKVAKRKGNVADYASLSCKVTIGPQGGTTPFNCNTLYSQVNTALDQFPRAKLVAQGYQHYRINKIAMTFKPSNDTFAPAGGQSKPSLFYMIDKSGSLPSTITLEGMKNMGARPRALDEKPVTISWSPSVLTAELTGPGNTAASAYKISPWLSTNGRIADPLLWVASSVDHFGIYWYAEALNGGTACQYQVDIEVQFQFKKPYFSLVAGPKAIETRQFTLDASSDGIADGRNYGTADGSPVLQLVT